MAIDRVPWKLADLIKAFCEELRVFKGRGASSETLTARISLWWDTHPELSEEAFGERPSSVAGLTSASSPVEDVPGVLIGLTHSHGPSLPLG